MIIKLSNAMQKVMLSSVKTFAVWLFFLCWQGPGHEPWSWVKMAGMLILTAATMWYIHLDNEEIRTNISSKSDLPTNASSSYFRFDRDSQIPKMR